MLINIDLLCAAQKDYTFIILIQVSANKTLFPLCIFLFTCILKKSIASNFPKGSLAGLRRERDERCKPLSGRFWKEAIWPENVRFAFGSRSCRNQGRPNRAASDVNQRPLGLSDLRMTSRKFRVIFLPHAPPPSQLCVTSFGDAPKESLRPFFKREKSDDWGRSFQRFDRELTTDKESHCLLSPGVTTFRSDLAVRIRSMPIYSEQDNSLKPRVRFPGSHDW
jgi:hypothetical protein